MNLYSYVTNDPVNGFDPYGLYDGYRGDYDSDLTDEYLQNKYNETYNRLRNKNKFQKYNPFDEANFDTGFYTGKLTRKWKYKDRIYRGNEINYYGIGMYEAWKGNSLEDAMFKAALWREFWPNLDPANDEIYEWLEKGYNEYNRLKEEEGENVCSSK